MNSEALAVVHRAGEAADFDLTPVARTGIHFTDCQGAPKLSPDLGARLMNQLDVLPRLAVERFGHKSGAENFRQQH
jgi:hypothetical protein